ncbi:MULTISPECIES: RecX family transcriptional regulator [unclassified Enterococcus]|uniref:RecX family transcriptional regulator n=1 Tax=unclassified Enterococcus TaxID=2608891 RepID=UPI0015536586|nr:MULTISPECIES: RecX family transcriptional regulator [unclassified Enterococcus]MBS7577830.1 RecX family transcriptional regulator [Enterococcus sp. MMGLQ5-2]MBS7585090.1 RecX family transcriptional regulator [Enterococcus sp. MMGLQ5-1]NPD12946.1 hypothetical protein [Enterococcus sp. MMGLQ5-1]NPD37660.1 hypothetical protein [Enterococcus sp. MMGLQ5-2]
MLRKVTEIKRLKKNYRISFDNNETLLISENTLTEFLITKDKLISDDLFNEIIAYQSLDEGKRVALTALNYRAYSIHEMKEKLRLKEIDESKIPLVIDFLKKNHLLNDTDYAQNIVESMVAAKKKGRQAVIFKLKQKGIHPDVIELAIEAYSDEQELLAAMNVAERLESRYYRESKRAQEQKITENLLRNGFSYDLAAKAVSLLEIESSEDEEYENLIAKGTPVWRRVSRQYEGWERKNRVFRNLAGKGFDFDLVNHFIEEMEKEENESI